MKNVKAATLFVILALVTISIAIQPASANPTTRQQSLKAYIDERYDEGVTESGYVLVNGESKRVEATYGAVTSLDYLGYLAYRPPIINMAIVKNFTWKLQWKPPLSEDDSRFGGFSRFISGIPDIESTFMAVKLYEILWGHETSSNPPLNMDDVEINGTRTIFYASKAQAASGGFGPQEGTSPEMMSTYQAIYTIYSLAQIESDRGYPVTVTDFFNKSAVISWIQSCRVGDAFKLSPASQGVGVTPTAAAVLTLGMLGETVSGINAISNWILGRQIEDDSIFAGGFEEANQTADPNIVSTYYALRVLELTNRLDEVNSTVTEFILDSQAVDGAWGFVPEQEDGSLEYAALAMEALDMFGNVQTFMAEEDPNNIGEPMFDWRYGLIIIIFIVAVVLGVIALRLD